MFIINQMIIKITHTQKQIMNERTKDKIFRSFYSVDL